MTRLRWMRVSKGWSVLDVVTRMERYGHVVNPQTVRAWERGRYIPKPDAARALARTFKVSLPFMLEVLGVVPPSDPTTHETAREPMEGSVTA